MKRDFIQLTRVDGDNRTVTVRVEAIQQIYRAKGIDATEISLESGYVSVKETEDEIMAKIYPIRRPGLRK